MKAAFCDECKYGSSPDAEQPSFVCAKSHKPRFYVPRKGICYNDGDWGWKRRCDDFVIRARGEAT